MNKNTYLLLVLMSCSVLSAQNNFKYWQQHVDYKMDVTVDVASNTYSGTQKLIYTNNSPEALNVVFTTCIITHFSLEAKWIFGQLQSLILTLG